MFDLQRRKPRQKPKDWNQGESTEHSYSLTSFRLMLSCLSCVAGAHLPREAIPHSLLDSQHQLAVEKMFTGKFNGKIFSVEVPSSRCVVLTTGSNPGYMLTLSLPYALK